MSSQLTTKLFFATLMSIVSTTNGQEYIRLKTGQVIECAILKQDTATIFATDWENRHLKQPPLQVFAKEEVESISFGRPADGEHRARIPFQPHTNGLEVGGGVSFQTWAESDLVRRHHLQLNIHGGYTILPQAGLELDGTVGIPFGGREDSVWQSYDFAYQAAMNIVVHPIIWKGLVPFGLVGGGAALGVPIDHVLLTSSTDVRNLVNVGAGVKTGANGIGFRMEWRHHFYTWTPDEVNEFGVRVAEHSADASVIRATIFLYK